MNKIISTIAFLLILTSASFSQIEETVRVTDIGGNPRTNISEVMKFKAYPYDENYLTGITVTHEGNGVYLCQGFTDFQLTRLYINDTPNTSFGQKFTGDPSNLFWTSNAGENWVTSQGFGKLGSINSWTANNFFYTPYIHTSSSWLTNGPPFDNSIVWKKWVVDSFCSKNAGLNYIRNDIDQIYAHTLTFDMFSPLSLEWAGESWKWRRLFVADSGRLTPKGYVDSLCANLNYLRMDIDQIYSHTLTFGSYSPLSLQYNGENQNWRRLFFADSMRLTPKGYVDSITGYIKNHFASKDSNNIYQGTQTFQGTVTVNGDFNATNNIEFNGVSINTNGTLTNVAYLGQSNTFTGSENKFSSVKTTALYSAPVHVSSGIDWKLSNNFTDTISGGTTAFTFSNATSGQIITIVINDGGGGGLVTFTDGGGSVISWSGGTQPGQTANKTDVYTFIKVGAIIYANVIQNF